MAPEGSISDLVLNSEGIFSFCAPSILIDELSKHQSKLCVISGYSIDEFEHLKRIFFRKITFFDLEVISSDVWASALGLTFDVDEDDTPFFALSIALEAQLWTGDKKLLQALLRKGVSWVLNTADIRNIRDKLR